MNFINYFRKHIWYIIATLVFVICSGFLLSLSSIRNADQVESQEILLFNISLNNWGLWITIIGALLASVWAMYQYSKATSIRQQEKASEIAKVFSDGLLNKCSTIIAVFQNSPMAELIDSIQKYHSPLNDFTTDTIRAIMNDDDFPSKYKKLKDSIDFDYIYFRVLEYRITTDKEYKDKYEKIDTDKNLLQPYTTEQCKEILKFENSLFPFHFSTLIDDVLNELEYVCISLSTHAAGSMYIYQSLHQIFFDIVETLSLEISIRNHGKYSDKFYSNIIHVYKEWKSQYNKCVKNELKKKDNKSRSLNPKIKTVE